MTATSATFDQSGAGSGQTIDATSQTGNTVIVGSPFNDTIIGSSQDDTICGGGGDDYIVAWVGDDHLWGENGDDVLLGDVNSSDISLSDIPSDVDEIHGGDGGDDLYDGPGLDHVDGGGTTAGSDEDVDNVFKCDDDGVSTFHGLSVADGDTGWGVTFQTGLPEYCYGGEPA